MHRTIVIFVCLAFLLALAACDKAVDSRDAAKPPQSEGEAGHAAEGVKAGSHEDWCGEHRVPESLCTRCNPALVAAFKASGDWCTEHGLPESQCLACNPDLKIERPPKIDEN